MDVRRIFDLLRFQQIHCTSKSALTERDDIGWETLSTQDCLDQVEKMSAALLKLGLEPGDRILVVAQNGSIFWLLLVQSILQLGAIIVLAGPEETDHEMADLLEASAAKFAFAESQEFYQKLSARWEEHKQLKQILVFYHTPGLPNLEDLLVVPLSQQLAEIQTFKAAIHEDDGAIFRYHPIEKAYQDHSHKEAMTWIKHLADELHFAKGKVVASYRPPSNWLEFLLLHTYLAVGAQIVFLKNKKNLLDVLQAAKPVACGSSKAAVENLRHQITALPAGANARKRWINVWAIRTGKRFKGRDYMSLISWGRLAIMEWFRYRHWRRKTGNRVDGIFIEGHLQPNTKNLMEAIGIPIFEQQLNP